MKKMTAAVLAALLMSPLGTSFYAACEAASTDLRVSSASSQPLPPSPPPDGMPPQGMPPQGGMGGFNPPQTVMQGTAKVTVTKAQTLTEKTIPPQGAMKMPARQRCHSHAKKQQNRKIGRHFVFYGRRRLLRHECSCFGNGWGSAYCGRYSHYVKRTQWQRPF